MPKAPKEPETSEQGEKRGPGRPRTSTGRPRGRPPGSKTKRKEPVTRVKDDSLASSQLRQHLLEGLPYHYSGQPPNHYLFTKERTYVSPSWRNATTNKSSVDGFARFLDTATKYVKEEERDEGIAIFGDVDGFSDIDKRGKQKVVLEPSLPNAERLRSTSPENEIARSMIKPTEEPFLTTKDINASTLVWAKCAIPPDPDDPLRLGAQCSIAADAQNSAVSRMCDISGEYSRATQEWYRQTGGDLSKEKLDQGYALMRQAWPAVLLECCFQKMALPHPDTGINTYGTYGFGDAGVVADDMREDLRRWWIFPGGFVYHPLGEERRVTYEVMTHAITIATNGLIRDITDNTSAYICYRTPAAVFTEQVGADGAHVSIGNHRFEQANQKRHENLHPKERMNVDGTWMTESQQDKNGRWHPKAQKRWRYVNAEDVDWQIVADNGGLEACGLVIIGHDGGVGFADVELEG